MFVYDFFFFVISVFNILRYIIAFMVQWKREEFACYNIESSKFSIQRSGQQNKEIKKVVVSLCRKLYCSKFAKWLISFFTTCLINHNYEIKEISKPLMQMNKRSCFLSKSPYMLQSLFIPSRTKPRDNFYLRKTPDPHTKMEFWRASTSGSLHPSYHDRTYIFHLFFSLRKYNMALFHGYSCE